MREREGLIARIRHLRRVAAARDEAATTDVELAEVGPDPAQMRSLETRVAHLEQLLEGLQDAVHREATRQNRRFAELEARLEPAELGRTLSKDARDRGL
jgi:hypothetical protein